MKRLLVILLLIGFALPVMANDALVLPENVMRIYTVPVYGFQSGSWDDDGSFEEAEQDETNPPIENLFNLGGALEYGLTNQISLGVQWAPGYNLVGNLDGKDRTENANNTGEDEDGGALITLDSAGEIDEVDLLVGKDGQVLGARPVRIGTEIQVLGNQGWIRDDRFRVQVAAGGDIGGWQRDWKEEGKNFADGDAYVDPFAYVSGIDPRYAAGGSLSLDYVINDELYVNVFGEYEQKFARDYDVTDFYKEAGILSDTSETPAPFDYAYFEGDEIKNVEIGVKPSYAVETELEVVYQKQVSDLMRLGGSLPFTVTFDSDVEADIDAKIDTSSAGGDMLDETIEDYKLDKSGYSMYLTPTLDVFLNGMTPPTQFLVKYGIPVAGKNASAVHQFILEGRVYLSF
ncbi:MAG: hypothetical protein ACLFMV_09825 [Spirochaetaceae bacterium]